MKKKLLFVFMVYCLIPVLTLSAQGSHTMCETYICGQHYDFRIISRSSNEVVLEMWSYVENVNMILKNVSVCGRKYEKHQVTTVPESGILGYGQKLKVTVRGGWFDPPKRSEISVTMTHCATRF